MHHVHLPCHKGFNDLRPGAEQARLFGAQAFGLKQLTAVGHQQRRGIGNGQIANAHGHIIALAGPRGRITGTQQRAAAAPVMAVMRSQSRRLMPQSQLDDAQICW